MAKQGGAAQALQQVMVGPKGAKGLRRGHPWCWRTEVLDAPGGLRGGDVVRVVDGQKNPIGQAFWAATSPLALRLLTREEPAAEPVDDSFFRRRLERAIARRASLGGRDALRLVHGEADLLPGLFVDRYGDALVVQTLSEGADRRKDALAALAGELAGTSRVVLRDDGSGRDFEGLPREARVLQGEGSLARYHEGETVFEIDLLRDAKTGSFLDQVDNHLRAGELARGQGLDAFSYHGGFALALARRCEAVLAVEQDEVAAARARANVALNGRTNVEVRHANAFDLLRSLFAEGRRFDTLVLDPPGLAKRKEGLDAARRAYHELNLRGLRLMAPDGVLVTCSCSGRVDRALFEEIVLGAARDAKRAVQVLERRGAGLDHPALAGVGETEYLKCLVLRVL